MKLQLIRHAESTANVLKAINTKMPGPPLTEIGHQQAKELAEQLASEPIVAVYSSIATRARQTARPLAERHGLAVTVLDGLQEVDAGDLEDRTDPEGLALFASVFGPWTRGELHLSMPGGETGVAVRDRFTGAVRRIREQHESVHPDATVAVICHGGVIRLCAELLADNVPANLAEAGLIPNTGSVVLTARDGGWHCESWVGIER